MKIGWSSSMPCAFRPGPGNCEAVPIVTFSSDLVHVEVLGVGVPGKVLLSRWILVASDASDTIPYVRAIDAEI